MMKNENGRSMVEMLGVLAIIGVLSVGGIAGYTMAMNKYRANEIAAEAAQCGILGVAAASVGQTVSSKACSDLMTIQNASYLATTNGMVVSATQGSDEATVTVTLADKTSGVQKALAGLAGSVSNFELVVTS